MNNIEWNKVTWYSKLAAVVVFVGIYALGVYVGFQSSESRHAAVVTEDTDSVVTEKTEIVTPPKKSTSAGTPVPTNTKYAKLVTLTASGFSPASVEIKVGQSVRFVNGTTLSMRVGSTLKQGSPIYAGFDEQKSVGKGGTYDFLFDKAGTWNYFNMNDDKLVVGTVVVTE